MRCSRTYPGQHFLGTDHTLANFETAFWRSDLADNNSFEQWEEDGSNEIVVRANEKWKTMLADYEPPPLDEARDEELRDYVASRKAAFPDQDLLADAENHRQAVRRTART